MQRNKLVVCLGASIVRGMFGAGFVKILERRMARDGFEFRNFGIGGDLSFNVLARVDPVIALLPDYIIILVGTNDVTAALYPGLSRISARVLKRGPGCNFTAESYQKNMLSIVKMLKQRTQAEIAIASLPVVGEDVSSTVNERVRQYNALLKEIAAQENAGYLPVHERQEECLQAAVNGRGRAFRPADMLMFKLILKHYIMRRSYDDISRDNGFLLLTDGIHMNGRGAAIIADLAEEFLRYN